MRLIGSPSGLRWLARRSWPDLPASARQRLEIVSLVERLVATGVSVSGACRMIGVSRASYYRWRKRLLLNGVNSLLDGRSGKRRRRPAPVRAALRERVMLVRLRHPMGKEKLRVVLARDGIRTSASTIQRVLSELFQRGIIQRLGYSGRGGGRRRRAAARAHAQRKRSGQRPASPGELVQIDTLHEYSVPDRPRFQFTAIDPVTRYMFAEIYPRASSRNAARFLERLTSIGMPFPIKSVQVDNGSEFKGLFEAACQRLELPQYTIPPASPKSNAKVERCQRTCREEHYAFEPPTQDRDEDQAALAAFVHDYNHTRPHQALDYQTPAEYAQSRNLRTCLN